MDELALPDPITDDQISGEEKLYRVNRLIRELREDFEHVNLLPFERNAYMEQLKVFGRNPENADPIFTEAGIEILTHHSFHSTSPTTSRAALQCLANALLARPITRQFFVELGYSVRAVARLKKPKKDDEFLMCRILFLTSYGTTQRFDLLIDNHHLADYVNDNIERHAKNKNPTRHDNEALNESLKLLFNVTHFCPSHAAAFSKSISNIMRILARRPMQDPPLASPTNLLISSLISMPMTNKKAIVNSNLEPCLKQLLNVLDAALLTYPERDIDATVVPLLVLFRRLVKLSPPSTVAMVKFGMLPDPSKTGINFPGSNSLHARLVDHLENPRSQTLYDAISSLFLEIVGGDTRKLTTTIGVAFSTDFVLNRQNGRASIGSNSSASSRSIDLSNGRPCSSGSSLARSTTQSSLPAASTILNGRRTSAASSAPTTSTNRFSNTHAGMHRPQSSTGSDDVLLPSTSGSTSSPERMEKERRGSRPVDTQRLMTLFDRLRVTSIRDYADPRMRAAQKDMIVELDEGVR